jgi:formamidopyrimidine-DNA glycosylase
VPELPDIVLYLHALQARIGSASLERIRIGSPFVLRTTDPPATDLEQRAVVSLRRLGKRIVIGLDSEYFIVIHLMIAGRLRWGAAGAKIPGRLGLAALDFSTGTLILTEAGSTHRAAMHLVHGETGLAAHDPGGLDTFTATVGQFRDALTRESHTVKRALTDPHLLDGIGNAYSDEILHAAKVSPLTLTSRLTPEELDRLYAATRATLTTWIGRLRAETGDGFPEKVTAFREGMAVHGRFRRPCPVCGAPVQRIRYAKNEVNYCATCQTGGRVLADRSLSRLLKQDWPRSLDEWETRIGDARADA